MLLTIGVIERQLPHRAFYFEFGTRQRTAACQFEAPRLTRHVFRSCVHACFARGATLGPTRAMPDALCSAHAPRCTPCSPRHAPHSSRHAQSNTRYARRATLGPREPACTTLSPAHPARTTLGPTRTTLDAPCSAQHALHSTHGPGHKEASVLFVAWRVPG